MGKTVGNRTFAEDVEFLSRYVQTIVLGADGGPQIVVVPEYQGRTMTSTAGGELGKSYAWINYDLIESGQKVPQINLYGGEDRFWLAPEGGQYSIFFDPGAAMDFAVWRVPEILDTASFDLVEQTNDSVSFRQKASIQNHSEFVFDVQFDRTVRLLNNEAVADFLGVDINQSNLVGHQSENTLTNIGSQPWKPETGLLGIWMLCMNKPSPQATIIVPYRAGSESELGPIVNADYFGKLDESRLKIDQQKSLIYFLGDGKLRSKLGLTFARALPILGSWDPELQTLSIVQFNLPDQVDRGYTNNLWEMQDEPFAGDVINSYNDGPNESGGMLGPFFELETLSPALALSPGENYCHVHRTIRLEGDRQGLSRVAEHVFGVDLDEIATQFGN